MRLLEVQEYRNFGTRPWARCFVKMGLVQERAIKEYAKQKLSNN